MALHFDLNIFQVRVHVPAVEHVKALSAVKGTLALVIHFAGTYKVLHFEFNHALLLAQSASSKVLISEDRREFRYEAFQDHVLKSRTVAFELMYTPQILKFQRRALARTMVKLEDIAIGSSHLVLKMYVLDSMLTSCSNEALVLDLQIVMKQVVHPTVSLASLKIEPSSSTLDPIGVQVALCLPTFDASSVQQAAAAPPSPVSFTRLIDTSTESKQQAYLHPHGRALPSLSDLIDWVRCTRQKSRQDAWLFQATKVCDRDAFHVMYLLILLCVPHQTHLQTSLVRGHFMGVPYMYAGWIAVPLGCLYRAQTEEVACIRQPVYSFSKTPKIIAHLTPSIVLRNGPRYWQLVGGIQSLSGTQGGRLKQGFQTPIHLDVAQQQSFLVYDERNERQFVLDHAEQTIHALSGEVRGASRARTPSTTHSLSAIKEEVDDEPHAPQQDEDDFVDVPKQIQPILTVAEHHSLLLQQWSAQCLELVSQRDVEIRATVERRNQECFPRHEYISQINKILRIHSQKAADLSHLYETLLSKIHVEQEQV